MARGVIPRQPAKAGRHDRAGQSSKGRAARDEPASARAKAGAFRKGAEKTAALKTSGSEGKRPAVWKSEARQTAGIQSRSV